MNIKICDYCSEKWPKHRIKMSRRPNDEDLYAELCNGCIGDIVRFKENAYGYETTINGEELKIFIKKIERTPAIGVDVSLGVKVESAEPKPRYKPGGKMTWK